jgi:H+/Cl- antiporter ClcA
MGIKLPDHSLAGQIERRWFNWMLGFAVAAGLVFYGRVAFMAWGLEALRQRFEAAQKDPQQVDSALEFRNSIELGNQIGWALVMIVAAGFLICAGMWLRELRRRARGRTN